MPRCPSHVAVGAGDSRWFPSHALALLEQREMKETKNREHQQLMSVVRLRESVPNGFLEQAAGAPDLSKLCVESLFLSKADVLRLLRATRIVGLPLRQSLNSPFHALCAAVPGH